MFIVETYVGVSDIDGLGVFTAVDIKKGQTVWEFDEAVDSVISAADYRALSTKDQEYVAIHGFFDLQKNVWIVGGDNDIYSNHAANSNLIESEDLSGVTPSLVAAEDIPAGTELTQNYLDYDDNAYNRKGIDYGSIWC